jgi:CRP-like cAMP-binding protein
MPNSESVLQMLRQSSLGAGLNDQQLAMLADIASEVSATRGRVLFSEGDSADALSIVCSGNIALQMQVPLRGSVRILTLGPRDILGWSALVGDGTMSTAAIVVEDAALLSLPAQKVKDLCAADHHLGYAVMNQVARALAQRLRGTRLQLLDLFSETEPS